MYTRCGKPTSGTPARSCSSPNELRLLYTPGIQVFTADSKYLRYGAERKSRYKSRRRVQGQPGLAHLPRILERRAQAYFGAAWRATLPNSKRFSESGPAIELDGFRPAPAWFMPWTILRSNASRFTLLVWRDCVSGDNSVAFYLPLLEYPQPWSPHGPKF